MANVSLRKSREDVHVGWLVVESWLALSRAIARRAKKILKWWRIGRPLLFFFPKARQRSNLKFQQSANLRAWIFVEEYRALSVEDAYIFMHLPKTAGTYVAKELSHRGFEWLNPARPVKGSRIMVPHYSIDWLIENEVLSKKFVERATVFAVTRDPIERSISAFNYLKRMKAIPSKWSFITFLWYLHLENPSIGGGQVSRLSHAVPQSRWLFQRNWKNSIHMFDLTRLSELGDWLRVHTSQPFTMKYVEPTARDTLSLSRPAHQLAIRWNREDFERLPYTPPT